MELEEALLVIEKHRRDVKLILRKITDRDLLKHLMRTESFSDMIIGYFSRNPDVPEADLIMEILQEISEEEAEKFPDVASDISGLKETARVYGKARDRYLLSFFRDPLASLLVDKLRLTPLKSAVLGLSLTFITYLVGFVLHFILKQPIAGVTKTSIDQIYDFSLVPLVFGYYVWISSKAGYLFLELKKRGIRLGSEQEFDSFAEKSVCKFINRRLWSVAMAIVTVCLIAITVVSAATYLTVWGPREANFILLCVWKVPVLWGLSWYMVFMIFIKETATIISLRRLLNKEEFALNSFHEDRQGGLKPIIDYATKLTYFVIACGYGFVLLFIRSWKFGYLRQDIIVNIGLLVYVGLACFFFFFPQSPAHRLVKRLKLELAEKEILPARIPLLPLRPVAVLKFAFLASLPIITLMLAPVVRG